MVPLLLIRERCLTRQQLQDPQERPQQKLYLEIEIQHFGMDKLGMWVRMGTWNECTNGYSSIIIYLQQIYVSFGVAESSKPHKDAALKFWFLRDVRGRMFPQCNTSCVTHNPCLQIS